MREGRKRDERFILLFFQPRELGCIQSCLWAALGEKGCSVGAVDYGKHGDGEDGETAARVCGETPGSCRGKERRGWAVRACPELVEGAPAPTWVLALAGVSGGK